MKKIQHSMSYLTAVLLMTTLMMAQAQAQNAEKGARIYKKCVACHMIGEGAKHRIGPHLNGIIGREIAGLDDYRYSKSIQKYARAQKIWDAAALKAYLTSPRRTVPGTRMSFAGLRRPADVQDVIAYMAKFTK